MADGNMLATAFVIFMGLLALGATALIIITVVPDKGQREETLSGSIP